MPQTISPLISLLLITTLAVIIPFIAARIRRIRIPIVVLEILTGIIIGQSGFNLPVNNPTLEFLAQFGFAFLMFLAGLEIDFSLLLPKTQSSHSKIPWHQNLTVLGIASFGLTLLLAAAAGLGLTALGLARSAPLMGLILSTTALGIILPVLKERNLLATEYGQALLVAALLADFITLILISLVIAVYKHGASLDLLLILLLGFVFAVAMRMGRMLDRWGGLPKVLNSLAPVAQAPVRFSLAFLVGWQILAQALGLEIILGAFLGGALISLLTRHTEEILREKLDAMGYGFFIPIFFISVGMRFNLRALLESPTALTLVPLLILLAYVVKIVPALIYRLRFSWRETLAAGFLLSSRLSLIIAASAIALEFDLINPATNTAIILVAIVTCTFSPLLFNRWLPPVTPPKREGIIIWSNSDLGSLLTQRLRQRGQSQMILINQYNFSPSDPLQPDAIERLTIQFLDQMDASRTATLIAADSDEEINLQVARTAKSRYGIPNVIAVVNSSHYLPLLQTLGIRPVQPSISMLVALEGAIQFPAAFDLISQLEGVGITEGVLSNPQLVQQALKNLQWPGGVLVMGVRRGQETIIPHGNTVLNRGDIVMLIGPEEALTQARIRLETENPNSRA